MVHRCKDFFRIRFARQHESVGHARHGQMGVGLTTPVPCRSHAGQARVEAILHVRTQDPVLDEHGASRRRAFVVHGQRAPAAGHVSLIDDRA